MKKLRIVLLPVALVLIGAGAAFATNAAKNSNSMTEPGYYFNNTTRRCVETTTQCSLVGIDVCTWTDSQGTHSLRRMINETTCGIVLYKP